MCGSLQWTSHECRDLDAECGDAGFVDFGDRLNVEVNAEPRGNPGSAKVLAVEDASERGEGGVTGDRLGKRRMRPYITNFKCHRQTNALRMESMASTAGLLER